MHDVPGAGPTVFVGSYAGRFYAFSARTGRTRWRFRSGGRISGSPTIVGGTVYFSDLGRSNTTGLRTRDGKVMFREDIGAFDPIISDGRHLFLTGRSSLTALLPKGRAQERADRRRAAKRRAARRAAAQRKRKAERRRQAERRRKARRRRS